MNFRIGHLKLPPPPEFDLVEILEFFEETPLFAARLQSRFPVFGTGILLAIIGKHV